MKRKGWYLIGYDIADPKRLKKIHKQLKNDGIAVQKSLFFVQGNEDKIIHLMKILSKKMDLSVDDLRAYPITDPKEVWTNNKNPLADYPVKDRFTTLKNKKKPQKSTKKILKKHKILWKRVFG